INTASLFSPSSWVLKAIELIPRAKEAIDGVEYHFFGDWNSVLVIADALNHLADFSDDLAVEVHVANSSCKANWDGQAADAAYDYFQTLRTDMGQHGPALRQAAKDLQDVAFGMESEAQALEGALSVLLDRVLILAVSAAVSAAASATGIGALSWAAVALEAYQAENTAYQVIDIFGRVESITDLVVGLSTKYGVGLDADAELTLPKPY
ncbi:MAG: hypothetical protein FWF75_06850, partial [Propionibacteriaceae bacterium]|nr:hypothetical protein [Propionibacteriaceae bacterium]